MKAEPSSQTAIERARELRTQVEAILFPSMLEDAVAKLYAGWDRWEALKRGYRIR